MERFQVELTLPLSVPLLMTPWAAMALLQTLSLARMSSYCTFSLANCKTQTVAQFDDSSLEPSPSLVIN